MGRNLGRSVADMEQFRALAKKAHDIVITNQKRDEDYEDAPEEFIGEFSTPAFFCKIRPEKTGSSSQIP